MKKIIFLIVFAFAFTAPAQSWTTPTQTDPQTILDMKLETIEPIRTYHPFLTNDIELVSLCFHHVGTGGILSVSEEQFRNILNEISNSGYIFVDASDLAKIHNTFETPPSKMAFISFDDGYEDVYTKALPILDTCGAKATFFIPSGKIGREGYLTANQVKDVSNRGYAIGSHTVTHPDLTQISMDVVETELKKSKETLEEIIGTRVDSVAYPCGEVSDGVVKIAQKYYTLGFLATHSEATHENPLKINRWGVFEYNDDLASIMKNPQGEA